MSLSEMAVEYINTGEMYLNRAAELRATLSSGNMGAFEAYELRRRIAKLENIGHEARATGRQLVRMYG